MVPKIVVVADIRSDARNWINMARGDVHFAPPLLEPIPEELLLKVKTLRTTHAMTHFIPWLVQRGALEKIRAAQAPMQEQFDTHREEMFTTMHRLTGKRASARTYTCYLTTYPCFPYGYKRRKYLWVGTKYQSRGYINTFLHELIHMQTHVYFEKTMRQYCDAVAFQHIKEALSVILNEGFSEAFMGRVDIGYPEDQLLREEIVSLWRSGLPFAEICMHMAKGHPTFSEF